MNNAILLIFTVASLVLIVLGLLFIAGFLFRRDLARMRATRSSARQRTRDPLALKNTLVAFFSYSKGSSRIIRLLAAKRKPLGYQALVDDIRFDERWRRDSDELPGGAILALLGIMQVAGLVHLTRHGVSITEVGRDVQRRIEPDKPAQIPQIRAIHSSSGNGTRTDAALSSADRTARRHRLEMRAHTYRFINEPCCRCDMPTRNHHKQKETPMKKRNIIITAPDHARLSDMIAFGVSSQRERGEANALAGGLERAEIVAPDAVPPDVITMNSRAKLLDLETLEHMEFTLVFPGEAELGEGKISVLAPVGAGMLGYRVGDSFERRTPHGVRRLKVIDVTFQPEAALVSAA